MAGEEDVELRDLVAHTLETRGVLGKIRVSFEMKCSLECAVNLCCCNVCQVPILAVCIGMLEMMLPCNCTGTITGQCFLGFGRTGITTGTSSFSIHDFYGFP